MKLATAWETSDKKATTTTGNQAKKSNEISKLTTKNKCDLRGKEQERARENRGDSRRIEQPYAYSNWNYSKYWNEKLWLLLYVGRAGGRMEKKM